MKSEKKVSVKERADWEGLCLNTAKGIPVESLEKIVGNRMRDGSGNIW